MTQIARIHTAASIVKRGNSTAETRRARRERGEMQEKISACLRALRVSAVCLLAFCIGLTFALLLVIGFASSAARAQEGSISLADYRARLAASLAALEHGQAVTDTLPLLSPVQLPSAEIVAPAPLCPTDSDAAVASTRLSTAIDQLDLSPHDDTAARLAQLQRVAERLDLLQPSLGQRFTRWFWEWIDRLWPDREPIIGGALGSALSTLVGWAVIGGGGLLLILLLSYWLRRLLAGMLGGRGRGDPLAVEGGLPATAAQARQQASQLAESGNFREAVRRLYLAALLRLRERDLIRFDSSLTNREVLARVGANAPARSHLEPVIETFDRVWYGEQEPDEATFRAYSREIDALLQQRTEARRG